MESGFRLEASVAMPHPADHASVSVVQPRGSLSDGYLVFNPQFFHQL
jgi:hypothetical protein